MATKDKPLDEPRKFLTWLRNRKQDCEYEYQLVLRDFMDPSRWTHQESDRAKLVSVRKRLTAFERLIVSHRERVKETSKRRTPVLSRRPRQSEVQQHSEVPTDQRLRPITAITDTATAELPVPVTVVDAEHPYSTGDHSISQQIDARGNALVSWHYHSLGLRPRRSRRYEGYSHV